MNGNAVTPRIFGREPALWIAAVQAVLILLATLGVPGIDDGLAAITATALTAVCTAWTALAVRPVAPAVFVGVLTALVPLLARFGLHLSDVQVGSMSATLIMAVTLIARGQITPMIDPKTNDQALHEEPALRGSTILPPTRPMTARIGRPPL